MKSTLQPTEAGVSRRATIVVAAVALGSLSFMAADQAAAPAPRAQEMPTVEALKQDLVVANRILFDEGFVDTAGHVSVRLDASRYLMAWRRAPGFIVVDDIMEYDLDGNVNDARKREPYSERFIHGEIYRARPDVRAVVHGHTESLVLFSSSNLPLRPVIAGARFIGESVPAFNNGDTGGGVGTTELGRGLAATLGRGAAVLMRGHGVVVTAPDLVALVGRAINLDKNARMVAQLVAMRENPIYLRAGAPDADGAAPTGSPGGDNSREWEAWKQRTAVLLGSQ